MFARAQEKFEQLKDKFLSHGTAGRIWFVLWRLALVALLLKFVVIGLIGKWIWGRLPAEFTDYVKAQWQKVFPPKE